MADLSIINQVSHNLLAWTIGIFILLFLMVQATFLRLSMDHDDVLAVLLIAEVRPNP